MKPKTYTLRNRAGMTLKVSTLGGTVVSLTAPDRDGKFGETVLSYPDVTQHLPNGHMNSLIGRVANRIGGGVFTLDGACTIEELTAENWRERLIPPDRVFEMPAVDFDGEQARKLKNGLGVEYPVPGEYMLYLDDEFYGIARAEEGILRAKVKLV